MAGKAPTSSSPRILLEPLNLEIADALNAGTTFASPDKVALKLNWSLGQCHAIHGQIMSWLKNDKQTELIELLRREPTSIAHPSAYWQLFYLRGLLREIDEDDVKAFAEQGASYDDRQPVLPSGIKPLAEEFLLKLLSAWVSGMLPGYEETPLKPFKRRGRNARWSTDDRVTILTEFGGLSHALHEIEEAGPAEVAPKKNESHTKFLKRMEAVVQCLNTRTLEYMFASIKTPATMTKSPVLKKQRRSLPNTVASKIVRQALPDKRLSKNNLLYGILAHHYLRDCRKIEAMRGLIEHGEADFPALDTRGHSHSSKS